MLIGVDEEGGTVVRVSSNSQLREKRFPSPQKLYNQGGVLTFSVGPGPGEQPANRRTDKSRGRKCFM